MDEEPTKKFPRSFEQLVLERFDALDARLERLESRSYDTKPIWEKALQEILETQNQLKELRTKIDAIEERVQAIEERVGSIEVRITSLETDMATLKNQFAEFKEELRHELSRYIDPFFELFTLTRRDMKYTNSRLTQLESKLA